MPTRHRVWKSGRTLTSRNYDRGRRSTDPTERHGTNKDRISRERRTFLLGDRRTGLRQENSRSSDQATPGGESQAAEEFFPIIHWRELV